MKIPRRCARAELRAGAVSVIELARNEEGHPREALALLDGDGEVRVYLNRCEHLPVPLDGGSRIFYALDGIDLICGTHGATYRTKDGFCTAGPCLGKSLLALPFRITADGFVELISEP